MAGLGLGVIDVFHGQVELVLVVLFPKALGAKLGNAELAAERDRPAPCGFDPLLDVLGHPCGWRISGGYLLSQG